MKRTDKEGETILTSAGMEDMDPDSLVEPSIGDQLAEFHRDNEEYDAGKQEKEEEEKKASLAAKVTFAMRPMGGNPEQDTQEFTASLLKFKLEPLEGTTIDKKVVRMTIKLGVEEAMQLLNIFTCSGRELRHSFNFDYVYSEESGLERYLKYECGQIIWHLREFEIQEIERSTCVCSVKLGD